MSKDLKKLFELLGWSVLFWTISLGLFGLFRYFGLNDIEGITLDGSFNRMHIKNIVFNHMFIGVLLGILYAVIVFFFDKIVSRKLALGFRLLLKTSVYFIVTVIAFTVALEIISEINQLNINNERGWWKTNRTFWTILIYITLCSLVFSFLTIASERFGRGIFVKMLLGKYKNPREENRIFMFLDLKDSTTIAETLGHYKYSAFIQECFYDLNNQVPNYDAEIYQYVGDEVVLSWPYKKGILNNNCIRLFYAFNEQLESKKEHYLNKYKVLPEFKAGIHGGTLMVTEVGSVKKELAYHGDVINTSARIQSECNNHNVNLLLSEKVLNELEIGENSHTESLGSVILKGKKKSVKIHTLINYV